jgi:DNA-binding transcriptional ArsR family regulator
MIDVRRGAFNGMMETLKALAEPNRFQIVELLRDGPRPVGDLVDRLALRQPQVPSIFEC